MGEEIRRTDNRNLGMDKVLKEDLEDAINHGIIVSNLSKMVAKEMGLDEETCQLMSVAGMLHDIGKLKLSKYLYGRRENSLAIEDIKYIRMHAAFSYEILKKRDYDPFILDAVYYHHENYDGSGYPDNLSGEDIPLGARIVRACDVFAALVSVRPYRDAFDIDTAIDLMIDEVTNFDMKVFLAFQNVVHSEAFQDIREFVKLCNETTNCSVFGEDFVGEFDT